MRRRRISIWRKALTRVHFADVVEVSVRHALLRVQLPRVVQKNVQAEPRGQQLQPLERVRTHWPRVDHLADLRNSQRMRGQRKGQERTGKEKDRKGQGESYEVVVLHVVFEGQDGEGRVG
jgi:hypothetical protein